MGRNLDPIFWSDHKFHRRRVPLSRGKRPNGKPTLDVNPLPADRRDAFRGTNATNALVKRVQKKS